MKLHSNISKSMQNNSNTNNSNKKQQKINENKIKSDHTSHIAAHVNAVLSKRVCERKWFVNVRDRIYIRKWVSDCAFMCEAYDMTGVEYIEQFHTDRALLKVLSAPRAVWGICFSCSKIAFNKQCTYFESYKCTHINCPVHNLFANIQYFNSVDLNVGLYRVCV